MPDSASAALPGSRRCVLSMVLNPRMPTLERRRDAIASVVSRRARIRHRGGRMLNGVYQGHTVRGFRSQKMTPPALPDGNRRCGHGPGPRMTNGTFWG